MNLRNLLDTIGDTPLVPLRRICADCPALIASKLESANPGGSVKDRIARAMISRAEEDGLLAPGGRIVEPTSGNTGIGLALVAAARGYSLTVTMPASMSIERRKVLASYGAELVLTSADRGMEGAIHEAQTIAAASPGAFLPMQFENPANPGAHRETTGPEIWRQTGGKVDILVSGVGTGGTITGAGEYLKSMRKGIRIVAVEPAESPVLGGGQAGPHIIEGIGAGFVPRVLNREIIDEVIAVTGDESIEAARRLAAEEGIFAGISSGAGLAAALRIAGRQENRGKLIVMFACDGGEKYLSTRLWG